MKAETIFKNIAESRLLKNLIKKGKIIFIGEEETVTYLEAFFEKNSEPCGYNYYSWQSEVENIFTDIANLSTYNSIIVASIKNEHIIFNNLKKYADELKIKVPILKLFSDIFVNLQSNQKLLQTSECKIRKPEIAYAVVSTPRSGSTVLCEALTATKMAGFPKEHFRAPSQVLTQHCQFDPVRYLRILMTNQVTRNGVFGTKLISQFLKEYAQSNLEFNQIINDFKFIYLIRRNKIAQAVSFFLGQKTNMWHIYSGEQSQQYRSKLKKINVEDADLEKVHNIYQDLLNQESMLEKFFHERQISPLIVEYEKFIEFPENTLNQIAKHLEILDINQQINVVNKYHYKLYEIMKDLKITGQNQQIKIKLKTRPLKSALSKEIISNYQEKYC